MCNGRGSCSTTTGECACFTGFSSSDGLGTNSQGLAGDCGYTTGVSTCAGVTVCSSRGSCSGSTQYKCTCAAGYTDAQCSTRTCPYGHAWWDEATGTDTAHALAECSNRGLCDRATGACTCQSGFSGDACQRLDCPIALTNSLQCAGHGTCHSLRNLATLKTTAGVLDASVGLNGIDLTHDSRQRLAKDFSPTISCSPRQPISSNRATGRPRQQGHFGTLTRSTAATATREGLVETTLTFPATTARSSSAQPGMTRSLRARTTKSRLSCVRPKAGRLPWGELQSRLHGSHALLLTSFHPLPVFAAKPLPLSHGTRQQWAPSRPCRVRSPSPLTAPLSRAPSTMLRF